jgi:hypothetical protein
MLMTERIFSVPGVVAAGPKCDIATVFFGPRSERSRTTNSIVSGFLVFVAVNGLAAPIFPGCFLSLLLTTMKAKAAEATSLRLQRLAVDTWGE